MGSAKTVITIDTFTPTKIFQLRPVPALRPFVDRLWGWRHRSNEACPLPTLLPGTGAELYFHFGHPFRIAVGNNAVATLPAGHLFCVRNQPITLLPAANLDFVAVRFRIGMIQRFVPVRPADLIDACLSVEQLWGRSGSALLDRISVDCGISERIAMIQRFLLRCLSDGLTDPQVEFAIHALYCRDASPSIETLASWAGIGRRQLERRWRAYTGQTPNELRCLIRFQRTVRRLMLDSSVSYADAALDGGYYDQAHFIHDFCVRAGASPHRYFCAARAKTHFYNTSFRSDGIVHISQ